MFMPASTILHLNVKTEAVEVTMLGKPLDCIPNDALSVAITTKRDVTRHNQCRNQTNEITKASFITILSALQSNSAVVSLLGEHH